MALRSLFELSIYNKEELMTQIFEGLKVLDFTEGMLG